MPICASSQWIHCHVCLGKILPNQHKVTYSCSVYSCFSALRHTRTLSALHINEWNSCVLIHQINWNCLTMDWGMFHPKSTALAYSLLLQYLFMLRGNDAGNRVFIKKKKKVFWFFFILPVLFFFPFLLFSLPTLITVHSFGIITSTLSQYIKRLLGYCWYWQFNAFWYRH